MEQYPTVNGVRICPFCKGSNVSMERKRTKCQLRCVDCGGSGPTLTSLDYVWDEKMAAADALSAWNRRPIEDAQLAQITVLQKKRNLLNENNSVHERASAIARNPRVKSTSKLEGSPETA